MRLPEERRALLDSARRAVLATTRADGSPRLVPCAYAVTESDAGLVVYSALDEKPKSVADPRDLGRVQDIAKRPRASVLVDRWSEDWSQLAWLRLDGRAKLIEPGERGGEHAQAVALLRRRYAQYRDQRLENRPVLRLEVSRVVGWTAASAHEREP